MRQERIKIKAFLEIGRTMPVLDVRSPSEYNSGHIPTALSFPLFTDEERAIVGTLYKLRDKKTAIKKGLQIVGPKMLGFVEKAESLNSPDLALYCWRGGMRSESMAWLLERYGFGIRLLEGGYKSYRAAMIEFFEQKLPLHVLSGFTGSKKTLLLHRMRDQGAQIIDLEGIANHQGSRYGNIKCEQQPSTEQFQNLVYDSFNALDLQQPIWIEDENMRIGQVDLMEALYLQKNESPHFILEVERGLRLDFLVEDYGQLKKEELIEATQTIQKKLGFDTAQKAIEYIHAGQLKEAAELILSYYDKRYELSITKKRHFIKGKFSPKGNEFKDLSQLAMKLIKTSLHVL